MNNFSWDNAEKASQELGVSSKTLSQLRERGYLKQGTHWRRITNAPKGITCKLSIVDNDEIHYRLKWCAEEMNIWKSRNAKIPNLVA